MNQIAVVLSDFTLLELPLQKIKGRLSLGHDHDARGIPVQAVHDARAAFPADAAKIAAVVQDRVDEGSVRVPRGGMHDKTGGLVQHEQFGILKEDGERDILRQGVGSAVGRDLQDGAHASPHPTAVVCERHVIQQDGAGGNELLDARAGES